MKAKGRVVFIRHGESIWNVTDPTRGLITKFTGISALFSTIFSQYLNSLIMVLIYML